MADQHYRSLVKAVSWRLTGSVDTMIISFLITGKLKWALTISGVELFTKIGLYYAHERVWEKLPFGRVKEPVKPSFDIEQPPQTRMAVEQTELFAYRLARYYL